MNIIPFDSSPKRFVPEQAANDRPTAVLLVCIYNKNSTLITHDIIYKAFSEYGEILKVFAIFYLFLINCRDKTISLDPDLREIENLEDLRRNELDRLREFREK